jgi:hypothetical protein
LKFVEINILGVYVAPIAVMMIAAWLVTVALRWIAARFHAFGRVWHPALLVFAVYTIVLSSTVLLVAR